MSNTEAKTAQEHIEKVPTQETTTTNVENELQVDLEARENLIKKEEHLMAIQRRAYELAKSSLPHGVFVDTELTSMFLTDSDTNPGSEDNSRDTLGNPDVGFDLNKASPIFIQFLAWQRLMQINQQIRIERNIAVKSNNDKSSNDENTLNSRVTNLIEKAASGTMRIEYHKDRILPNYKLLRSNHKVMTDVKFSYSGVMHNAQNKGSSTATHTNEVKSEHIESTSNEHTRTHTSKYDHDHNEDSEMNDTHKENASVKHSTMNDTNKFTLTENPEDGMIIGKMSLRKSTINQELDLQRKLDERKRRSTLISESRKKVWQTRSKTQEERNEQKNKRLRRNAKGKKDDDNSDSEEDDDNNDDDDEEDENVTKTPPKKKRRRRFVYSVRRKKRPPKKEKVKEESEEDDEDDDDDNDEEESEESEDDDESEEEEEEEEESENEESEDGESDEEDEDESDEDDDNSDNEDEDDDDDDDDEEESEGSEDDDRQRKKSSVALKRYKPTDVYYPEKLKRFRDTITQKSRYAHLVGGIGDDKTTICLLKKKETTFGRSGSNGPAPDLDLSSFLVVKTRLARFHGKITWNTNKDCFYIHVLSRNGFLVDGKKHRSGVIRAENGTTITIRRFHMTLVLPPKYLRPK